MQADEEYGNMVWDKHFGSLYDQLKAQKYIYQISGFLNPFISLLNLSMGVSGTDMYHHLDFLVQAEKYRRVFIKSLNDEYAFGGSKTGQRGWKATNEFFRSVKEFKYQNPTFTILCKIYYRCFKPYVLGVFACCFSFFFIKKNFRYMKMINIFFYESKHFMKSKAKLLAYLFFVLACVYAIYNGFNLHDHHLSTIENINKKEDEKISQVVNWFKNGEKGPKDRDWIDVTDPYWCMRYSPTYIFKTPSPLYLLE